MKKYIKIIPLKSIGLSDLSSSEPSDPGNPGSDPLNPSFPSLSPQFSFLKSPLPGYGTSLPATEVEFSFPAEDYKRVQAWFSGDFSHVVNPESATLKKNMRAAVIDTLSRFISASASRNLLTAPCRLGWRYRLFDGSYIYPDAPLLILPEYEAPLLIITGYNLYEKSLHTDITISVNPSSLSFSLAAPQNGGEYKDIIMAVEFFVTRQGSLFSSDAEVVGVRSVITGSGRVRVWSYESIPSDDIEAAVKVDSDFRLVATLSYGDILDGKYDAIMPFPFDAGALGRISSLPKVSFPTKVSSGSESSSSSSSSTLLQGWRPFLHFHTEPLNLGLPENVKSVMDLYLRGVFQREEVEMKLYGSHHREHWRLLAKSRGPYIRGLRRAPYRWFRVEISLPMRRDDFLEALTFTYAK
ncbi:MAG: hypothetical protein K2N05_05790 [Muribaculaceae bacterium]|nr:hypothetical protein [Muribaculaceae bacterium]